MKCTKLRVVEGRSGSNGWMVADGIGIVLSDGLTRTDAEALKHRLDGYTERVLEDALGRVMTEMEGQAGQVEQAMKELVEQAVRELAAN